MLCSRRATGALTARPSSRSGPTLMDQANSLREERHRNEEEKQRRESIQNELKTEEEMVLAPVLSTTDWLPGESKREANVKTDATREGLLGTISLLKEGCVRHRKGILIGFAVFLVGSVALLTLQVVEMLIATGFAGLRSRSRSSSRASPAWASARPTPSPPLTTTPTWLPTHPSSATTPTFPSAVCPLCFSSLVRVAANPNPPLSHARAQSTPRTALRRSTSRSLRLSSGTQTRTSKLGRAIGRLPSPGASRAMSR